MLVDCDMVLADAHIFLESADSYGQGLLTVNVFFDFPAWRAYEDPTLKHGSGRL
jgi:hypothetical protein